MKHKWQKLHNVSNPTGSNSINFYQCERCRLVAAAHSMKEASEKHQRCVTEKDTPVDRGAYYEDELEGRWIAFLDPKKRCMRYGKAVAVVHHRNRDNDLIVEQKTRKKNRHIPSSKVRGVHNRRNNTDYPIIWEEQT